MLVPISLILMQIPAALYTNEDKDIKLLKIISMHAHLDTFTKIVISLTQMQLKC